MSDITPPGANGGSAQSSPGSLLNEPRSVPADRGMAWIKAGFGYFKQKPVTWAVMGFLFFLLMVVLSTIPILSLLTNLLSPVFLGGLLLGCAALDRGEGINVNYLYRAFSAQPGQLMMVGVLYGLGTLLVGVVIVSMLGVGHVASVEVTEQAASMFDSSQLGMAILLGLILMVPLFMAYVFAIPLVLFHQLSAFDAMKLSYRASIRNLGAIGLFFLLLAVLGFIAAIPMGLGFAVLIPTMSAATYAGYKEILRA